MDFSTPTTRWAALTTRNRLADTHFVYAVKTTKVYCRPSCSARLARRANVEFYTTPSLAAKAGFRACKRCKPDLEPQDDPQDVAVAKACEIIQVALSSTEHANGHIGLNELAERVQLTPSYLHKTFKAKMGVTPKAYAETLRTRMNGSKAMVQSNNVVIPELPSYDDICTTFTNDTTGLDFDFGDAGDLDSVSEAAGLTLGGFSEGLASISTPMTIDWSWLDAPEHAFDSCEFLDAEVLAQAILHQEAIAGWTDQVFIPYGKDRGQDRGHARCTERT